jgi:hypothetical protein
MDLDTFIVNPITLVLVILGVVEFIKKLGVTGNKLMLISMFVGIFFAVMFKLRELYPLVTQYIDIAFYGIFAGLGASGVYSFINDRFPAQTKATIKYTKLTRTYPAESEVPPQ